MRRAFSPRAGRFWSRPDTAGTIVNRNGLDIAELIRLKDQGRSVCDSAAGEKLGRDALIDIECDIWIPAARPDVVREDNVQRLNARLVLQGANIPFTAAAERTLAQKGVLVVPDFIANAGGVICAAMEWHGATQAAAFEAIAERIRANTASVLEAAAARRVLPRQAAVDLARERVRAAMATRRGSIF